MTLGLGTLACALLLAAIVYWLSAGGMSGDAKNVADVMLTILGMGGAVIAFQHTIREWRDSQRWKKSERLDKLIEGFESDKYTQVACTAIDWTARRSQFGDRDIVITNNDVLLALRPHAFLESGDTYPGEQSTLREAFDALLNFFCRIEFEMESDRLDPEPTKPYFSYWLERFVTMDRHPDKEHVLGGKTPSQMVAEYIAAYSDIHVIVKLCRRFNIDVPRPLIDKLREIEHLAPVGSSKVSAPTGFPSR